MANLLASSISNKAHLSVFDEITEERNAALDIEKVLIYVIDQVDEKALLPLAVQFDLMGVKGWDFCSTTEQRRQLIKRAIELHRYKGTPYGVKEALKLIGFFNTIIQEHLDIIYDGTNKHDGSISYGGGNWATFRIIFDLGNDKGISEVQTDKLLAVVDEFKNVRSRLLGYSWRATLENNLNASEELSVKFIYSDVEQFSHGIDYNGVGNYDGTYYHDRSQDFLEVNEIQ